MNKLQFSHSTVKYVTWCVQEKAMAEELRSLGAAAALQVEAAARLCVIVLLFS